MASSSPPTVEDKVVNQVHRMLTRWSGVRVVGKSDVERNLTKEEFCERPRDDIVETHVAQRKDDDEEGGWVVLGGAGYMNEWCVTNKLGRRPEHWFVLTESPRQIGILDQCQVLVVGGGPSGIAAALGARRAGCDVVLMERFGCFGGVITTVGMETIAWYRYEGCTNDVTVGEGPEVHWPLSSHLTDGDLSFSGRRGGDGASGSQDGGNHKVSLQWQRVSRRGLFQSTSISAISRVSCGLESFSYKKKHIQN